MLTVGLAETFCTHFFFSRYAPLLDFPIFLRRAAAAAVPQKKTRFKYWLSVNSASLRSGQKMRWTHCLFCLFSFSFLKGSCASRSEFFLSFLFPSFALWLHLFILSLPSLFLLLCSSRSKFEWMITRWNSLCLHHLTANDDGLLLLLCLCVRCFTQPIVNQLMGR